MTNSKKIFVDTSAWIEFVLKKERYHKQVFDVFDRETKIDSHFFTSDYVLNETFTRLVTRQGISIVIKFKELIDKAEKNKELSVLFTSKALFNQAWLYFKKFSEHELSFTDATIYTFAKELRINEILTLDQGFTKIGLSIAPKIRI